MIEYYGKLSASQIKRKENFKKGRKGRKGLILGQKSNPDGKKGQDNLKAGSEKNKGGRPRKRGFLQECKRLSDQSLFPLLQKMAKGRPYKRTIEGGNGEFKEVEYLPKPKEQLDAIKMIVEYGYGKPNQRMEVSADKGMVIVPDFKTLQEMKAKEKEEQDKKQEDSGE